MNDDQRRRVKANLLKVYEDRLLEAVKAASIALQQGLDTLDAMPATVSDEPPAPDESPALPVETTDACKDEFFLSWQRLDIKDNVIEEGRLPTKTLSLSGEGKYGIIQLKGGQKLRVQVNDWGNVTIVGMSASITSRG